LIDTACEQRIKLKKAPGSLPVVRYPFDLPEPLTHENVRSSRPKVVVVAVAVAVAVFSLAAGCGGRGPDPPQPPATREKPEKQRPLMQLLVF
jgi:predicted small lipoprotein YifL